MLRFLFGYVALFFYIIIVNCNLIYAYEYRVKDIPIFYSDLNFDKARNESIKNGAHIAINNVLNNKKNKKFMYFFDEDPMKYISKYKISNESMNDVYKANIDYVIKSEELNNMNIRYKYNYNEKILIFLVVNISESKKMWTNLIRKYLVSNNIILAKNSFHSLNPLIEHDEQIIKNMLKYYKCKKFFIINIDQDSYKVNISIGNNDIYKKFSYDLSLLDNAVNNSNMIMKNIANYIKVPDFKISEEKSDKYHTNILINNYNSVKAMKLVKIISKIFNNNVAITYVSMDAILLSIPASVEDIKNSLSKKSNVLYWDIDKDSLQLDLK